MDLNAGTVVFAHPSRQKIVAGIGRAKGRLGMYPCCRSGTSPSMSSNADTVDPGLNCRQVDAAAIRRIGSGMSSASPDRSAPVRAGCVLSSFGLRRARGRWRGCSIVQRAVRWASHSIQLLSQHLFTSGHAGSSHFARLLDPSARSRVRCWCRRQTPRGCRVST